jgi:hypothetical protein
MLPHLTNSAACLKFVRLHPPVQELYYGEHGDGNGGMILTGESRIIGRETCSSPIPDKKSHMGWPEKEPGLSGNYLPELWQGLSVYYVNFLLLFSYCVPNREPKQTTRNVVLTLACKFYGHKYAIGSVSVLEL